jgi:hypothetical protein
MNGFWSPAVLAKLPFKLLLEFPDVNPKGFWIACSLEFVFVLLELLGWWCVNEKGLVESQVAGPMDWF